LPTASTGTKLVSFTSNNVIVDMAETEYTYPVALQSLGVVVAVPEPRVALLMSAGLALILLRVRNRRRVES
jgi:hypothetical protein